MVLASVVETAGSRGCIDRRGQALGELDVAQRGDGVEIVGGADPNVDVGCRGFHGCGSDGLGREHPAAPEAKIAQGNAQGREIDMVDRDPSRPLCVEHGHELGAEAHDNGRRVGSRGINGEPVSRDESHRVHNPPAHHPNTYAHLTGNAGVRPADQGG